MKAGQNIEPFICISISSPPDSDHRDRSPVLPAISLRMVQRQIFDILTRKVALATRISDVVFGLNYLRRLAANRTGAI